MQGMGQEGVGLVWAGVSCSMPASLLVGETATLSQSDAFQSCTNNSLTWDRKSQAQSENP